jgi:hypothetical protein
VAAATIGSAAIVAAQRDQRGLGGEALGGTCLHLVEEKHVVRVVEGDRADR